MAEVCLNVQPYPQPHPAKSPGGDCFACCLTAALRHLCPEASPSFEEVWNLFVPEGHKEPSHSWPSIEQACYAAVDFGIRLDVQHEIVQPWFEPERSSHPWWFFEDARRYALTLEAWLSAGWLAIAEIDFYGKGPMVGEGHNSPNHNVLFDGVRHVWEPFADEPFAALRHYIHVICSVKGAYWIEVGDLLRKHGAAGWVLIRKEAGKDA